MSVLAQDVTTYPNLGFNPVPGVPADVESMSAGLAQAVASMQESGTLLGQMRDALAGDASDRSTSFSFGRGLYGGSFDRASISSAASS